MKQLFLFICITFTLVSHAQEKYTFKSGGRVFDANNQRLNSAELRTKFSDNTDFLKLYNAGRTKKTVGNILLYTGISTIIIKHIAELNVDPGSIEPGTIYGPNVVPRKDTNNIMYFVGAGLIVTAIPIKIGLSKKIRKSVDVLNGRSYDKSVGFLESQSIILDSDGVGLRMTF